MTTTAPLVDPRVIGLAHYAGRAVLETVLARRGATFQQMVALRLVAVADGALDRDQLTTDVVDALKVAPSEADRTVAELLAADLMAAAGASSVRLTEAGRELFDASSAETSAISARIYAGIPDGDRAVAGRVLALVTERANAELAALTEPNG
ncbi:MarR family transcriptional regulator [Streptomyces sp. MS06]|uniref:MarR family transcriptional regulator n=1 Tax=Streptomyces sp. MS06 TaxID=3385974 RepID=UPI0039A158D5